MTRIDLLFPPPWDPGSVVYLALPTLSAYLRARGVEVVQRDVNLRVCREMLKPERLVEAREFIADALRRHEDGELQDYPAWFIQQLRVFWAMSGHVIDNLEKSIARLKSESSARFEWHHSLLVYACRMLSLAHYPSEWTFDYYRYAGSMESDIDVILDHVDEDETNLFLDCYRRHVVPELRAGGSRVFGICLAFVDQLVPGLTLARVIKEEIPDAVIVVGGPQVPYMQDALLGAPRFFSLVDFVVNGEGERPLFELLQQLDSGRRFSAVPNLMYRGEGGEIVQTASAPEIEMEQAPEPDFDAYGLDETWAHARSMPYLSVRGCYWGKCAFCSINSSYGRKLRSKPIPVVVRELQSLIEKYGCQSIEFADEAISPARMLALSKAMIAADVKASWFALTRLENRFSSDILDLAYAAGCRLLSWGLESGSQRTLDRMNKHISRADALRILEQSHRSGIWNHAFIIIGFPGETEEDFEESIAFVQEASGWIDSLNFGPFRLERCTAVFDDPDAFGIRIAPHAATHCSPMYAYQDQANSERQLRERLKRFERFAASLPASFASSLPIGQRLAMLATTAKTDAEIRGRQTSQAARHGRIPEILQSPLQWRVEWDSRIHWEEVSLPTRRGSGTPLEVAICPDTGKAILLGKKTADLVRDPASFQSELARAPGSEDARGTPFLELAEVVLKALPFTPHGVLAGDAS
jgi:hypothetical protein